MKTETLSACREKLWPESVHNHIGSSPDEIHNSTVDKYVNLAKQFGEMDFMMLLLMTLMP